jgi:uncharacterized membrane protein YedE/YeeE
MQTEFTPFLSLLGGGLIGASAVLLMATHGRIAGISGILSRILPPTSKDQSLPQGLIFLIGLLLAAPIWVVLNGQAPLQTVSNNLPLLALAGVLVGFGSVLGNGCTSGHGVCGISRLSRSLDCCDIDLHEHWLCRRSAAPSRFWGLMP